MLHRDRADDAGTTGLIPKWRNRFREMMGGETEGPTAAVEQPETESSIDEASRQVGYSTSTGQRPLVELGMPIFLDDETDVAGEAEAPATLLPLEFGDQAELMAPWPLN